MLSKEMLLSCASQPTLANRNAPPLETIDYQKRNTTQIHTLKSQVCIGAKHSKPQEPNKESQGSGTNLDAPIRGPA